MEPPHNSENSYLRVLFGVEFKSGINKLAAPLLFQIMRPKNATSFILNQVFGGQNSKTNNIFIVNIPVNQRHRVELSTCTIKNRLDK